MLKIAFDSLHIDPPGVVISDLARACTNIGADLRLYIDGRLFLYEPALCVVELAYVIARWLAAKDEELSDFQFESMDDEVADLLCFQRRGDNMTIAAARQQFVADEPLKTEQVLGELNTFVRDVVRRCADELGVAVDGWIDKPGQMGRIHRRS